MSRGRVYTDELILSLLEEAGPSTAKELAPLLGCSENTVRERLHDMTKRQLVKQADHKITASVDNGGRPAIIWEVDRMSRPTIVGPGYKLKFNSDNLVGPDQLLAALGHSTSSWEGTPKSIRQTFLQALYFPFYAPLALLLNSRRSYKEQNAIRDDLVKEGEQLIKKLTLVIDRIKNIIYSPEFIEPSRSGFNEVADEWHDYAFQTIDQWMPFKQYSELKMAHDQQGLLPQDSDPE